MSKLNNAFREIFSGENGKLSSKRVVGGFAMLVALICTIVLVARDGSTQVVENLLQTIFIISTTLLGVANVTGIWKNNKITMTDIKEDIAQGAPPQVPPEVHSPDCEGCQYKGNCTKKGTE